MAAVVLFLSGCTGPRVLGAPSLPRDSMAAPSIEKELNPGGERCAVSFSQGAPLVTEWPATEKANLEILTRKGAVAVAFSGCSMKVLSNCALPGKYLWNRITPVSDYFEIADEDELYAKLPLGAVSLEGELKRWGKLGVQTAVSGQLRLEGIQPEDIPRSRECDQATHVIGAVSVGAFNMTRAGGDSVGAGVDVQVASAGGKTGHSATIVRAAGQPDSCVSSTDAAPHPNCASPIQVFLWNIPEGSRSRAASAGSGDVVGAGGEPGGETRTADARVPDEEVRPARRGADAPLRSVDDPSLDHNRNAIIVDLVSARADRRWDVYVDDEVICSTPCTKRIDPNRPVLMRARPDGIGMPEEVSVPNLFPAALESGEVQLLARPTQRGQFVTGLTFTSLGGMAVMTGGMLAALGCSDADRAGLCNGGLITAGVGTFVAAGAVWLIVDSLPRAFVAPIRNVTAALE